jgi:hypothetical protein
MSYSAVYNQHGTKNGKIVYNPEYPVLELYEHNNGEAEAVGRFWFKSGSLSFSGDKVKTVKAFAETLSEL